MLDAGLEVKELIEYKYLTDDGRDATKWRVGVVYWWEFPVEDAWGGEPDTEIVPLLIKWGRCPQPPFLLGKEVTGPKYIVTGKPAGMDMPLFLPTRESLKQPELVFLEGEKDALTALELGGIAGAVGLPTASYTPEDIAWAIQSHQKVTLLLDRDSGGVHGADRIAQGLASILGRKVYKCVWPEDDTWEGTDISDFFAEKREGLNAEQFKEWLQGIIGGAVEVEPPAWSQATRSLITGIICDPELKPPVRKRVVAEAVIAELKSTGRFYQDAAECPYYFSTLNKQLYDLLNPAEARRILHAVGINKHDVEFNHVHEELICYAEDYGEFAEVEMVGAEREGAVYADCHDGTMVKITAGGIRRVDNGTDGVLFVRQRRARPIEGGPEDANEKAFWELFNKLRFTRRAHTFLAAAYAILLFKGKRARIAAPILVLQGEHQQGKSSVLRLIGWLLYGSNWDVSGTSGTEDDYWTKVKNSGFIALDNADRYLPWTEEALAITATGGIIERRTLYTNSVIHDIEILCNIALSSRTPHFRRPDVADRSLLTELRPLKRKMSDPAFKRFVLERRTGAVWYMFQCIQHSLQGADKPSDETMADIDRNFRMVGWAEDAISLGLPGINERQWKLVFWRQAKEKADFVLERYRWWDALYDTYSEAGKTDWLTAAEILRELNITLGDAGPLKDPKSKKELDSQVFGTQLFSKSIKGSLERLLGMEVDVKRHKKTSRRARFGYFPDADNGESAVEDAEEYDATPGSDEEAPTGPEAAEYVPAEPELVSIAPATPGGASKDASVIEASGRGVELAEDSALEPCDATGIPPEQTGAPSLFEVLNPQWSRRGGI